MSMVMIGLCHPATLLLLPSTDDSSTLMVVVVAVGRFSRPDLGSQFQQDWSDIAHDVD